VVTTVAAAGAPGVVAFPAGPVGVALAGVGVGVGADLPSKAANLVSKVSLVLSSVFRLISAVLTNLSAAFNFVVKASTSSFNFESPPSVVLAAFASDNRVSKEEVISASLAATALLIASSLGAEEEAARAV